MLVSTEDAPFYILTSNAQFLHIQADTCWVWVCLFICYISYHTMCEVVLMCISLMIRDVEHLFTS